MKIRKVIVALAAVLVPFLVFRVGSGLTEQQNVTLRDYMVSENEKTLERVIQGLKDKGFLLLEDN